MRNTISGRKRSTKWQEKTQETVETFHMADVKMLKALTKPYNNAAIHMHTEKTSNNTIQGEYRKCNMRKEYCLKSIFPLTVMLRINALRRRLLPSLETHPVKKTPRYRSKVLCMFDKSGWPQCCRDRRH